MQRLKKMVKGMNKGDVKRIVTFDEELIAIFGEELGADSRDLRDCRRRIES